MLQADKRQQLDGIVQTMLKGNESDSNIQFVVDDFKKKYDVAEQVVQPQESGFLKKALVEAPIKIGEVGTDFFKGVGKGALSTLQGISTLGQKGMQAIGLQKEPIAELPKSLTQAEGTAQQIGRGAEQIGEFVAGGLAVKAPKLATQGLISASKLAPAIKNSLKILTGSGLEGLGAGFVKLLQTGGDIKESAKTAGIAGAITVPFEALRVLSAPASELLKKGAEKKVSQALAPTTKENKQLADRIVPEMLKRRIKFMSREGLVSKADEGLDIAGQQLEDAYSALPANTKVSIAPIIEKLEKSKGNLIVKGTNTIPEAVKSEHQAIQNIQQEMIDVANGNSNVGIESLRNYRQILDSATKKAGAAFGFTGKEKAGQLATKSMANAIRSELAKEFPDIAKINAEYNFWSNVKQVTSATIQRTKGQGEPLGRQIMEAAGFAGGLAAGGWGNAISSLLSMHFLKSAITSPAWRNTSALVRQQIADSLASGNTNLALDIIGRIAIGTEEAIRENVKKD